MKIENRTDIKDAICKIAFAFSSSPDFSHKTHGEVVQYVTEHISGLACIFIPSWTALKADERKFVIQEVVNKYEIDRGIKSPAPHVLEKNKNSKFWLYKAKETQECRKHFENYKKYLIKCNYASNVVEQLEKTCEQILSRCANPFEINEVDKKKKGLVVGDVQSGKTSNYMGLINMAFDYGYKIVVLLAGTTNSLRLQTQKRVDKGAIGAKSNTIGSKSVEYVGVGADEQDYYVIPFTSQEKDFVKDVQESIKSTFNDYKKPVLLVVKKNQSVLKCVSERLLGIIDSLHKNSTSETNSLLIIDDEADNASVNVSANKSKPSSINKYIREIYNKFPIVTYVGYTATPFANVFIQPDEDDGDKDLFPEDFIIQLSAPTNYFGGRIVFPYDVDETPLCLKRLDPKEENFLPVKHDRTTKYRALAESLKDSIRFFLLGCVIRSLRGQETEHRSMMINISRYNDVQLQILERVQEYVQQLQCIIEQTFLYQQSRFLENKEMKRLYEIYTEDKFFASVREGGDGVSPVKWSHIQEKLNDEAKQIQIAVINSRNGDINKSKKGSDGKLPRFDYDEYDGVGARVIAIGGMVLSRGLTLEGLMISYYSRNAGTYDSLLQMCRWFGYRPGYEDLCRVFLSSENITRFCSALEAVEDLKQQFEEMERKDKKPKNFGLMVRENPYVLETKLLITAKNKCRGAESRPFYLNYGGVYGDTSKMYKDPDENKKNRKALEEFLKEISLDGKGVALNIPKLRIASLVKKLVVPYLNKKFDTEGLSKYIEESECFHYWDVVVESGSSDIKFNGREAVKRSFILNDENDKFIRLGGNNNRVMEPGVFEKVLSKEEKELAAIRLLQKKNDPDPQKRSNYLSIKDYLYHVRQKPLFVIYPVELKAGSNDNNRNFEQKVIEQFGSPEDNGNNLLLVFGFGFPNKESEKKFVYLLNKIKQAEIESEVETEDEEEGADNEE